MKIGMLVFFLLTFFIVHSQTEFAPIGAEWYYCLPDRQGNPFYSYEKYISQKDTIIEEKQCKVVKSQFKTELIYVDQHKVYYRFNERFNLLYDFSAELGDTICFDFKSFSPNSLEIDTSYNVKCVIQKIDSTLTNGKILKTYESKILRRQDLDHLVWDQIYKYTERIGFESDFMYVLSIPTIEVMTNLRCYVDNDVNFKTDWWNKQDKPCSYSLINSSSYRKSGDGIEFYPNPAYNHITIKLPQKSLVENCKLQIFDISGREICSFHFNDQKQIINISHFKFGTYYFYVSENGMTFKPFKIVKK